MSTEKKLVTHCMTVDIEDWYHIYPIEKWDRMPSRVEDPTLWILNEFSKRNISATFFILGYIAERHPDLIKEIHSQGHEIGIHGYDHKPVFKKAQCEFERDIRIALDAVEKIIGYRPEIYRAPSFSVTKDVSWVWHVLAKNGIKKDSSLFAAPRLDGGYPNIPEKPFLVTADNNFHIVEYPIIPKRYGPLKIPYTGGGYFRLLPLGLTTRWLRKSSIPIIFYIHPRDLDADLPVIDELESKHRWKIYYGLKSARKKFKSLLDSIPFSSIEDVYKGQICSDS